MPHQCIIERHRAIFVVLVIATAAPQVSATGCSHSQDPAAQGSGGNAGSGNGGGSGATGGGGSSGSGGGPAASTPGDRIVDGAAPDVAKIACADSAFSDMFTPRYMADPKVTQRVQNTLNSMSLTQQASQMRGTYSGGSSPQYNDIFRSPDDTAAKVAGFQFRDGPRGVVLAAQLPSGQKGYSTAFPVASARGAAFDTSLEYKIGAAIGDEMLASHNSMILAPVINILRHPAWGRSQETYGEDTYLLGRLGSAFVAGAQQYVPACAKHYAANNIENARANDNAVIEEQTLREMYARHFGVVIQDAGIACVMASYNLVNGTKSTINTHLLTDILRTDFGFKGLVLTDWWAMPPGQSSTTTDQLQGYAVAGVNAGLDLELPWSYNYAQIEAVVQGGKLTPMQIATSAGRILEQKFRFNVDPLPGSGQPQGLKAASTTLDSTGSIANGDGHIQLARQAAVESMVLLKNDKNTLPIDRAKVKTVAVIGAQVSYTVSTVNNNKPTTLDFARDPRLGDMGSSRVFSDPAKSTGPFAGIQAVAGSAVTVVAGNSPAAAANADFVVVVAGLTPQDEGEEYTGAGDRDNFSLDDKNKSSTQNSLVAGVAALNKPMVVVLEGGSVIDMPWLAQVPAVVMAWYPGQDGGRALGQLLFADAGANFSGKLPVTWPVSWNDEPQFADSSSTTKMDYYVGYSFFDNAGKKPLFPFGYGLSYTTFKYEYIAVPCSSVTKNGVVEVQVAVTNTGPVAGDEVSFLFVSYPSSTMPRRPLKELKGFHRGTIDPGKTLQFTIPLRVSDLRYWDDGSKAWQVQSGAYQIQVGPSSDNLPLKDTLTVQ
jgi:beta-glucosidase